MANPNLENVSSVLLMSGGGLVAKGTSQTLIANPEGSGLLYRICSLYATPRYSTQQSSVVYFYLGSRALMKGRVIEAHTNVIAISNDAPVYLQEGQSIGCYVLPNVVLMDMYWVACWEVLS